uniref:Uncharacterized protein n=1 Tax=Fagus sylvatica TaxID=28930 RepID=A0A2N9ERH7_FAGSY
MAEESSPSESSAAAAVAATSSSESSSESESAPPPLVEMLSRSSLEVKAPLRVSTEREEGKGERGRQTRAYAYGWRRWRRNEKEMGTESFGNGSAR